MKVQLVKEHGLKAWQNFEEHRGKIFEVLYSGEEGYNVDLAPLGHPGVRGWMYEDEAEVVDDSLPVSSYEPPKKKNMFLGLSPLYLVYLAVVPFALVVEASRLIYKHNRS